MKKIGTIGHIGSGSMYKALLLQAAVTACLLPHRSPETPIEEQTATPEPEPTTHEHNAELFIDSVQTFQIRNTGKNPVFSSAYVPGDVSTIATAASKEHLPEPQQYTRQQRRADERAEAKQQSREAKARNRRTGNFGKDY